jgi:hypothetical protein
MRSRILFGAAMVVALLGVTGIASAAPSGASPYTCTGGDIPSGNYASITVTGFCDVVPNAVINVTGNLNVAAGALFDAQSAPSTITVGHNVTAGAGSLLGLGCQPFGFVPHAAHPCTAEGYQDGHSVITVDGNVTATDSFLVLLNGITVNRNVTLTGGGGGGSGGNFWAEKNDTIGGNLTISDVTADFFGLEFSTIAGNATLTNITALDPDDGGFGAVNIVVNTIGRNLNCENLGPRLSGGTFPGEFNTVGHNTTGQCVGLMSGGGE